MYICICPRGNDHYCGLTGCTIEEVKMIVRFRELSVKQLSKIQRGTIVLDYQYHPYVVLGEANNCLHLCDMSSNEPLSLNDSIPYFVSFEYGEDNYINTDCIIELDDWYSFSDWNVIL